MSNIRIKDLTTTAATTASDDFVAVDGTTNGTRKLNAFSPTFGGNLTASGGSITVSGGAYPIFYANGTTGGNFTIQKSGVSYGTFYGNDTNTVLDSAGSANLILQTGGATRATLTSTATTLTGNLTVSGTGSINGGSGTAALTIKETASAATALLLTNRNSTQTWGIAVDAAAVDDKQLAFISGGNVVLSLNATTLAATLAGNVLVGTTTDGGYKLDVNGTARIQSNLTVSGGTTTLTGTAYLDLDEASNRRWRVFPNGGVFTVRDMVAVADYLTITGGSGDATVGGSIKTRAPSGGTAKPWELGEAATVSPTSPNRTIRVEIDGTVYYIHAKTTND
jgi:hypothetical protein